MAKTHIILYEIIDKMPENIEECISSPLKYKVIWGENKSNFLNII